MRQAAFAVLLFVFSGPYVWAGIAEDIAAGKPLLEVVQAGLASDSTLKDLIADLHAAGVSGPDIIYALFQAGQDHSTVIIATLDSGLGTSEVAGWAHNSGATQAEIQQGYSMAGKNLPTHWFFSKAERYERNAEEYRYNPPSPSK